MSAILYLMGTPLNESIAFNSRELALIERSTLFIGESRSITQKRLRNQAFPKTEFVFIDQGAPKDLRARLIQVQKQGGSVVLTSDSGMPILFDPGKEVLEICRELSFQIRTSPGATSFGTAMAASALTPPFLVYGFLPQKTEERQSALSKLCPLKYPTVFLDTPYRFLKLVEELKNSCGGASPCFLAWNIELESEALYWGTLDALLRDAPRRGWKKGEFILIVAPV